MKEFEEMMREEIQEIKRAITNLNDIVACSLKEHDERLKKLERKQEKVIRFQKRQEDKILELSRQVKELIKNPDNIVWSSGFQKGVEKEKVYDLIDQQRLNRSLALDGLIENGVILAKMERDGTLRRTPKVRISPTKTQRVILVLG